MNKMNFIVVILAVILLVSTLLPQTGSKSERENKGVLKIVDPTGEEVISYKKSYALLIGVWDYDHWKKFPREYFEKEMKEIEDCLINQGFEVRKVLNPTYKDFMNELLNLKSSKDVFVKENRLLFFFSGHGYNRAKFTKGYLVPKDAPIPDSKEKEREFLRKAINFIDIASLAETTEVNHFLFLLDCCYSGIIFQQKGTQGIPINIKKDMANPVRQFITAGKGNETVPVKSCLIPAFVRGISKGEADRFKDGYITGIELFEHIKAKNVPCRTTPQYGTIRLDQWRGEGNFVFVNKVIKRLAPECTDEEIKKAAIKLEEFKRNFTKVENDIKPDYPEASIFKWKKLLADYSDDIPCFEEDKDLREEIKRRIASLDENVFERHMADAEGYYQKGYHKDAETSIDKAKKIKITENLLKLEKKVNKKLAKVEKIKVTRDNQAFKSARKQNTIKSYKKYMNDFPLGIHVSEAYHNIGVIYSFQKNICRKAIEMFTYTIDLNPKDAEGYNNRGVCYTDMGHYDESIKDYEKAKELYLTHEKTLKEKQAKKINQKLAIVYNNLGVSYSKKRKPQDAINNYDKAIKLNEKYGDAYYNRGMDYLKLGKKKDIEQAISDFNKAIKNGTKDSEVYKKLAAAYEKNEQKKEAEEAKKKAKKFRAKKKKNPI